MNYLDYIRTIPDFPKPGIQFKDITPLLNDAEAFNHLTRELANRYRGAGLTRIVGIESRGFIFGAALAHALGLPFVPIRKLGKLPAATRKRTYELEYGQATIELHVDALTSADKVLLIDDLLATGGTLEAAAELVAETGAIIHGIWVLVELGFLSGREKLARFPLHAEIVID